MTNTEAKALEMVETIKNSPSREYVAGWDLTRDFGRSYSAGVARTLKAWGVLVNGVKEPMIGTVYEINRAAEILQ